MTDFSEILDWDNIFSYSEKFKKNKPFKHIFVENPFKKNFYGKLYNAYPKIDATWKSAGIDYRKRATIKVLIDYDGKRGSSINDPSLGPDWNKFIDYIQTDEYISNMAKFSGIKVTNLESAGFYSLRKGDFQLPHVDGLPSKIKIQTLYYFSKNWQKGDPGGTYFCKNEDESTIFFEPYNLDNSFVMFDEAKNSWHGTRFITKDVLRQAFAVGLS